MTTDHLIPGVTAFLLRRAFC